MKNNNKEWQHLTPDRTIMAIALTAAVVCSSLFAVYKLYPQVKEGITGISILEAFWFYVLVMLIYIVSTLMWRLFTCASDNSRTLLESVVDTGFLAIGKYVPGKIIGIALRGSIKSDGLNVNRTSLSLSFAEQLFSLAVGVIFTGMLWTVCYTAVGFFPKFLTVLCGLLVCGALYPILCFAARKINQGNTMPTASLGKLSTFVVGYLLLWTLTSLPILLLITQNQSLSVIESLQVITGFSSAMIAGWIAILTPAGIGVREGIFALTAPQWMTWQQGLFWVALHRGLFALFDLAYGFFCLILLKKILSKSTSHD